MNNPSLHTLVNFRANRTLLESFDRVCMLTGKTRTQVLAEMMRHRVMSIGSKLPAKLASERAVDERLRAAVAPTAPKQTATDRGEWSPELYDRRRFSLFGGDA